MIQLILNKLPRGFVLFLAIISSTFAFENPKISTLAGQPDPTRPPPKVFQGGTPQCDVFSYLILGADIAQNAGQLAGAALEAVFLLHIEKRIYSNSVVAQEVQAKLSPSTTPITRATGNLAKLLQKEVLDLSKLNRSFEGIAAGLKAKYGNLLKKLDRCGNSCAESVEGYIEANIKAGKKPEQAGGRLETLATGCGNSFAAKTLIWTSLGLLPISSALAIDGTGNVQAQAVTQVWSYNEITRHLELNPVNHVFVNEDKQITTVIIQDPKTKHLETITTTPEHPFYAKSNAQMLESRKPDNSSFGWVNAGELKAGSVVWQGKNTTGIVTRVKTVTKSQTMYNLEVNKAHTYFVGAGKWLVHNQTRRAVRFDCKLGTVPASPEGAKLAQEASDIHELLPKGREKIPLSDGREVSFSRKGVTIAVGTGANGKKYLSMCCDGKYADFELFFKDKGVFEKYGIDEMLFNSKTAQDYLVLPKSARVHAELVQIFEKGADVIGISKKGKLANNVGGACIDCQLVLSTLEKNFPGWEVANLEALR
jgi:Pretoxin HINT domain